LITPAAGGWTEAVRMQITEVSVLGVRSAVVALRHPERPLRFVLIPMVHIAQARFYRQVADRLRKCQLIVAEGYDGPSSVGLAYAVALRVTRQRSAARLVHQNLDYEALGVPVVWPEGLYPSESHWRRMPVLGWLDVVLLVPALVVMMAMGGRNWLLRRNLEVSDDTEPRLFLSFLQKMFVHDRDRDLLAALAQIHETRADEPIDVAVVYGAAHMPAVVNGLRDRFGYRTQRGGDWLTAIDF
jgi:hypothetical protein